MELKQLISEIKKDSKIPTDEILNILAESVENEDSEEDTFCCLFKKAYGGHVTQSLAADWVSKVGERWTLEQTTEVGQKMGVDWSKMNKYEWYAVMNVWADDFKKTAQIYETDGDPEFFGNLVLDYFIRDTDAKNKSVFRYYFAHVV